MRRACGAAASLAIALLVTNGYADEPAHGERTPVTIASTKPETKIFIARETSPGNFTAWHDEGRAPIEIFLKPGDYAIETNGPSQALGHDRFHVEHTKVAIDVEPGNQATRTVGTIALGAGLCALLGGLALAASFGPNKGSSAKWDVTIPFLVAGGGLTIVGSIFTFAGKTDITAK